MKKLLYKSVVVLGLIAGGAAGCSAQPTEPKNVAIFLYQGVELLDFAGPGEVFTSANFKVFTVSVDGKELLSQGFVTIKPQYSIADAPAPDIIVFPGGNSSPSAKDQRVQDWIKVAQEKKAFFMSVCTGASILARAHLLDGMNVTTFHGYISGLQSILPNSKVLENTRFVDNGGIITTAGVSAGIDGALHLVSRIKGLDEAKAAAFYMEYDKWDPKQGRVDRVNENIRLLKEEAWAPEKRLYTLAANASTNPSVPYVGELKNLAFEFRDQGQLKQAAYVLETATKIYPNSTSSFAELARLYAKLGKPGPLDDQSLSGMLKDGKVDEVVARIEKDRVDFPTWNVVNERTINLAGYDLLGKKDIINAIKIFQLNTRLYPQSANAFDSLGEAYMLAGHKKEAVSNYKKSLELNPKNDNAKDMLAKLE